MAASCDTGAQRANRSSSSPAPPKIRSRSRPTPLPVLTDLDPAHAEIREIAKMGRHAVDTTQSSSTPAGPATTGAMEAGSATLLHD